MVLETLIKLYLTEPDFLEKVFLTQKLGEMGQNRPKIGFLDLKKKFGHSFHWICSTMKMYMICCIPAQTLYLRKILFMKQAKTLPANQIAGFSNQPFLQSKPMKEPNFLYFDTNFPKLKSWLIFFWLVVVEPICGQSGLWFLKLIVYQEWTDRINWIFASWHKFTQTLKDDWKFLRWSWSKMCVFSLVKGL